MFFYEDAQLASFMVTHRREILFYLRQLIAERERINVLFNDGQDSLLTVLLDIDEASDVLVFDWGGSEAANQRLLASRLAFFVAHPVGVRNQFVATEVWPTQWQGRPAFAARLPDRYLRLQRRECFRLGLPVTQRIPVTLRTRFRDTALHATVVDIGLGGVGLETQESVAAIAIGEQFLEVTIPLASEGMLLVDLEACYTLPVTRGTHEVNRMGCRFVTLGGAQEHALQRFITRIQLEDKERLG